MNRSEQEEQAILQWLKQKAVSVWPTLSWDLTDEAETRNCAFWWYAQLQDFLQYAGYDMQQLPQPDPDEYPED